MGGGGGGWQEKRGRGRETLVTELVRSSKPFNRADRSQRRRGSNISFPPQSLHQDISDI